MLTLVDNTNELERLGCAAGFGYCAANHLDMTLEKVQATPKSRDIQACLNFFRLTQTQKWGLIFLPA